MNLTNTLFRPKGIETDLFLEEESLKEWLIKNELITKEKMFKLNFIEVKNSLLNLRDICFLILQDMEEVGGAE